MLACLLMEAIMDTYVMLIDVYGGRCDCTYEDSNGLHFLVNVLSRTARQAYRNMVRDAKKHGKTVLLEEHDGHVI